MNASSESQGQSVGSGKAVAKVFKNGQETPWDASLNEPDLALSQIHLSDWAQKYQSPASVMLLS